MGKIICAGLGPGDPDLMSVKSRRVVENAQTLAYFRKTGAHGRARAIVNGLLAATARELPMEYPVTTELPFDSDAYIDVMARFYDDWAQRLGALTKTEDCVVLCEGDPFFYGSFMHLYTRLQVMGVEVEVIPGITGMSGCWTASGQPITWGDDVMTVLMGTMKEDALTLHMERSDALVVMKIGRHLERLRRALGRAGRLKDAFIIEHGSTNQQSVQRLIDYTGHSCPYFAIVLVHGQGRRPERRQ